MTTKEHIGFACIVTFVVVATVAFMAYSIHDAREHADKQAAKDALDSITTYDAEPKPDRFRDGVCEALTTNMLLDLELSLRHEAKTWGQRNEITAQRLGVVCGGEK